MVCAVPVTYTTERLGFVVSVPVTQQLRAFGRPDVLVLGAGQAGLTAALAAAQSGARVLILEKRDIIGGSTAMSSGLTAYAGTDEQAAMGVEDSIESLRQDILTTGQHKNDPALVDAYCREQLTTYRWLKGLGVQYGHVHAASGQSVPRSHSTDPGTMVDTLLRRAEELGVVLLHEVRALELMMDGDAVVGVRAEIHGAIHEIPAGSVVLATGGFSRSPELLERFVPQMAHAVHGGAPGSEGDGLLMGWRIGADFKRHPLRQGHLRHLPRRGPPGVGHRHPRRLQGRDRGQPRGPSVRRRGAALQGARRRLPRPARSRRLAGLRPAGDGQGRPERRRSTGSPAGSRPGCSRPPTRSRSSPRASASRPTLLRATVDALQRGVPRRADGRLRSHATCRAVSAPPRPGRRRLRTTRTCPTASVLATYCGLTVDARTHVLTSTARRSRGSSRPARSPADSTAPAT